MASEDVNLRREKFKVAYARTLHGTNAAIEAGYSPASAHVTASRLLSDAKFYEECMELVDKSQKKAVLTLERLDQEIARLAFGDVRKLYDDSGNMLPVNQWSDDDAATVASIRER